MGRHLLSGVEVDACHWHRLVLYVGLLLYLFNFKESISSWIFEISVCGIFVSLVCIVKCNLAMLKLNLASNYPMIFFL